jgi:mono/diheme cytochrome c family protein
MGTARILVVTAAALLGASPRQVDPDHAAKMARGLEVFKQGVRPVLEQRCAKCHSGETVKSKLDLSDRDGLLRGGENGPAAVAGSAKASLLYRLITHSKEPHMPHKGPKLSDGEIARVAEWIDLGAPYDKPLVAEGAPKVHWTQRTVPDEARKFWAFQPLRPVEPPAVAGKTPVDRFILAKLEAAGIAPNPPADRRRLARRAALDLTGLPPTPEEVEALVSDTAPDAWERFLDRLLAGPAYGERWGRHWLDVARFAESHGFEQDYNRENAFYYRDFVIRALNDDLPFDRFVQWQVAGDELAPGEPLAWMATGFLGAGAFPTQLTEVEFEPARYDELDNMASTVGTAMLGLTVGCARCHDHKYDPIPARDFYRLASTFTAAIRSHKEFDLDPEATKRATAEWEKAHAPFAAAIEKFEKEELPGRFEKWRAARPWEQPGAKFPPELVKEVKPAGPIEGERFARALAAYKKIDDAWKKLDKAVQDSLARKPKPATVMVTTEGLKPLKHHADERGFKHFYPETHFLARGDVNRKEGVAPQGFLQVLTRSEESTWIAAPPAGARTPHRRAALARWLTDVERGAGHLLARVIVNRLWHHHFGRGIVATPSDFGAQGERPSHPELLDWLAGELIRVGWRLKPIHKLLMTSAVYQRSGASDPEKARRDPDGRLFWRWDVRRLEAETVRDAVLSVSGLLDRKMFGPGTLDENSPRRSVYFMIKRSQLISSMMVLDAPESLVSIGQRPTTTVAPQALLFMNNPLVRRAAVAFAKRVEGPDAVRRAYAVALGRAPSDREDRTAAEFLARQSASYGKEGKADGARLALADLCQVLMSTSEFIYVE